MALDRILIRGRTTASSRAFVEEVAARCPVQLDVAESPAEVLDHADVVVTATTSPSPLFRGELVRPGTHVNAVGAFTPTTREVDGSLVARATTVADTFAGAESEAGDLLLAREEGAIGLGHVRAELGEILLGRKPGRQSAQEITLFKSVGAAFQDAVTARLAYERALAAQAGRKFQFV
jgi:ornithine cyclodeaminase/alanine dehydrogenase-like protein (mu-crystallin family)